MVRCVLEFRCGWVGVVSMLQAEAQLVCSDQVCFSLTHGYHPNPDTLKLQHTTNVVIQQKSRRLLPDDGCSNVRNMLSIEVKKNLMNCDIKLVSYSSTTYSS